MLFWFYNRNQFSWYIYSLPLKLPSRLQIITEGQAGLCVLYTNYPLSVLHMIVYICQCHFVDIFKRWNSILEFRQENIFLYGGLVSKSCLNLVTTWTVACQAPLSISFPRQEYWSGLPFPSPGDLPYPGIKPRSPAF